MNATRRLLMVDDDPDICDLVRDVAEQLGFTVSTHTRAEPFVAALAKGDPDIAFIDISMPRTDGIELLSILAKHGSRAKIYIMSGFEASLREAAIKIGRANGLDMRGIIAKPARLAAIREALMAA